MRRLTLILAAVVVAVGLAAQASAATTIDVKMTFAEPLVPNINAGCTVFEPPTPTVCGHGQVVPLGHATENVQFGAGCGGSCDLRTITLAGGTLIINETFSNPRCPGICGSRGLGVPFGGDLSGVVVGGTGAYAGASGTLTGTVRGAGGVATIKLAGTITIP